MYYYVLLLLVLHTMVLLHTTPSGCILGIRYVRTAAAPHHGITYTAYTTYIHTRYYIRVLYYWCITYGCFTTGVLHTVVLHAAVLLWYYTPWYTYTRHPPYIAYLVVYYIHSIHTWYYIHSIYSIHTVCSLHSSDMVYTRYALPTPMYHGILHDTIYSIYYIHTLHVCYYWIYS